MVYKITKTHIQISTQLNDSIRARLRDQACVQVRGKIESIIWNSLLPIMYDRTYDLIREIRCHM